MHYVVLFGVAAGVTFLATPLVHRLAGRLGAIVVPGDRRVHARPTPTLGGLAMLAGFLAAIGVARTRDEFEPVFESGSAPLGLVVGAVVVYAVGFIDDLREISAPAKTAGMVLAGSIINAAGISVLLFRLPPVGLISLSPDWAAFVTVVAVVGMCNAINFIDGLDGLAAGIVAIASGAVFLFAERLADPDMALLPEDSLAPMVAVVTAGICVGFLPVNFHPARMFMGDGGALMLGLLMAVTAISVGGNSTADSSGQTFFFFAPLFIPLVILGVPVADTVFAILRRMRSGIGASTADKGHLHHRLMDIGHGHRRAVMLLWIWTGLLSALVLYPTYAESDDGFLPIGIAALALVLYTVFHPRVRAERRAGRERRASASEPVTTPIQSDPRNAESENLPGRNSRP